MEADQVSEIIGEHAAALSAFTQSIIPSEMRPSP